MILIPEPDKVKEAEVRAAQAAPEEKRLPEVEQLRNELKQARDKIRQLEAENRGLKTKADLEKRKPEAKIIDCWNKAQSEARGKDKLGKRLIAIRFAEKTGMI